MCVQMAEFPCLYLLGNRQVARLTAVVVADKQKNILRKPGDTIIIVV
jgi:hypothetical protein